MATQSLRDSINLTCDKASIEQVKVALDAASGQNYKCRAVSWEDVQRGYTNEGLSCWGPNISDVRLWEKSGKLLYTLRSDNWNEKLGFISVDDLSVIVGNDHTEEDGSISIEPITFGNFLRNITAYSGLEDVDSLYNEELDKKVSIRFQTVFLPISDEEDRVEFCTESYNYNTHSDSDPRNLLILCTPQGTSVQQDGFGAKKIFYHGVNKHGSIERYWLEAEKSKHKVGSSQKETSAEIEDALSRGKATAIHIGTEAMQKRFNVQMLIQVPLKQKEKPQQLVYKCADFSLESEFSEFIDKYCGEECFDEGGPRGMQGVSNAARVSRGSKYDTWDGLTLTNPVRDPNQHITVTVTMYYTVMGGVPKQEDVKAAVKDLEALYESCNQKGGCKRLQDDTDITTELTNKTMSDIIKKVIEQPHL